MISYILYSICLLLFIATTALYFTRNAWVPLLPYAVSDFSFRDLRISRPFYTAIPSTFSDDIESGLTSEAFDLRSNVAAGDSRSGLDDNAKREISRIMRGSWIRPAMDFDEARRVYTERTLERQGIGRDGRPKDPKFVSFS